MGTLRSLAPGLPLFLGRGRVLWAAGKKVWRWKLGVTVVGRSWALDRVQPHLCCLSFTRW